MSEKKKEVKFSLRKHLTPLCFSQAPGQLLFKDLLIHCPVFESFEIA